MAKVPTRRPQLMDDFLGRRPDDRDPDDLDSVDAAERLARIAALGMMHLAASQQLLEARGHRDHGANIAAALKVLTDIVAEEIGGDRLSQAIDWASNEMWDCFSTPAGSGSAN